MRCLAVAAALLIAPVGCKRPSADRTKKIEVTTAEAASAAGYQVPRVTVRVAVDGFTVSMDGAPRAPGCASKGAGLTVPLREGEQDFAALTRCLDTLQSTTPALGTARSVELAADGTIAYGTVIATMDAIRKTSDGRELFPEVVFAAPKRDR